MGVFSRLPHRRPEVLFALLVFVCLMVLQWLAKGQDLGTTLSLSAMELVIPALLGVVTAGLLADDPGLELLLSLPRPAHRILVERILVILSLGAFMGAGLQILAGAWGIYLPFQGIRMAFTWFSPLVFYTGWASSFALMRGRMLDGVIACLVAVGASLLSIPLIGSLCQFATLEKGCGAVIFYPMLTSALPLEPNWPANRVFWLMTGASLLATSCLLTRRSERLLPLTPID